MGVAKYKVFFERYVVTSLLSLSASFFAGLVAHKIFENPIITALSATWADNIFYYGRILILDIQEKIKAKRKLVVRDYGILMRNMIVEFGPAEIIDTFVTRPFIIYFTVQNIENSTWALFVGIIISSIVFYIPTVYMYYFRKKHFKE